MTDKAQQKTIRTATLAVAGVTALMAAVGGTGIIASLDALTPVAISALFFLFGALSATAVRRHARSPVLGAVALAGLLPLAPLLPDPGQLALIGAFGIAGLLLAGVIGPVVAAFARERLAAISGSLGLGLIAYIGIRAGLATGPIMQAVLALCILTASLAMTSAMLSGPARATR